MSVVQEHDEFTVQPRGRASLSTEKGAWCVQETLDVCALVACAQLLSKSTNPRSATVGHVLTLTFKINKIWRTFCQCGRPAMPVAQRER